MLVEGFPLLREGRVLREISFELIVIYLVALFEFPKITFV